jgi:hypothetical protein
MFAGPCPLVEESDTHAALVVADHEHSRSEFTVRLPVPPDEGSSEALFESVT